MIDYPITLRELRVLRIVDITPAIRCVTLGGDQLDTLVRDGIDCPAFVTGAPDDHVKIFPPIDGALVLPTQDHGHLDWPADPPEISRDYTVRRFDPATNELDLEFLLDHDGPGAAWANGAAIGDPLHVAGPRVSIEHPLDAPSYVLIGDEAALPAIARFFDDVEHPGRITAIVVADEVNTTYPLPAEQTQWLVRDDHDVDPVELHDRVSGALVEAPDAYVWAALEFQTTRDLRAVLKELGVERSRQYATHYWRRPDRSEERAAAARQLGSLTDLLTPMVIRVAVTVGLFDAIADGGESAGAIAARIGCDHEATGMILRHLVSHDVLRRRGRDRYGLTPVGRLLVASGDEHSIAEHLSLRLADGHMVSALTGLLHAVETGGSGYEHVHGRTFWEALSADGEIGANFDRRLAGWANHWAPVVADDGIWTDVHQVVDVGGGSGALATALAEHHEHLAIILVELQGPAQRTREVLVDRGLDDRIDVRTGDFFEPLPTGADVYVLAQIVHDWPDDDARCILSRCADAMPADGRLLVVERLDEVGAADVGDIEDADADGDDDGGHPGAGGNHVAAEHAAMSVLMLALFGAKERTRRDYEELLADAGLTVVDARRLAGVGALGVLEARRPANPVDAAVGAPGPRGS